MSHRRHSWPLHATTVLLFLLSETGICHAAEQHGPALVLQQYACGTNGMDLEALHECGVTLLSHFDWTLDGATMTRFIAKAHALGIRLLPHISAEKAWYLDTPTRLRQFNRRSPAGSIPYYRAVDPSLHREWILVDELGRLTPRYGCYVKDESDEWVLKWGVWKVHGQTYEDAVNPDPWSWYMCSSAVGYIDAGERASTALALSSPKSAPDQ